MFLSYFSFQPSKGSSQGFFRLQSCYNEADQHGVLIKTVYQRIVRLLTGVRVGNTFRNDINTVRCRNTWIHSVKRGIFHEENTDRERKFPALRLYHRVLTIKVCVCKRNRLTSTGPVRHQHVAIQAVTLVAPIRVHAPVFAGPWL